MTDDTAPIYHFAKLDKYSFRERWLIRLADLGFYLVINAVGLTVRFTVIGGEHPDSIIRQEKLPIYATWHDRIFLGTYFMQNRGIAFLASQSFDGEYISRFLQRFSIGVIRGSSTRGGSRALVEMIRWMRKGVAMGFTLDGPKGPRYVVKPGAVLLAKKTGNPILPFIIEPRNYKAMSGWDKLQIPFPFTSAAVIYGDPIYVDADADAGAIEAKNRELQTALDSLVQRGREWREADSR